MCNWFKKKVNVVKFIPCVSSNEISDFVVKDFLVELTTDNSLNVGLSGSNCLINVLAKLSYNLKRHDLNYANVNFFNLTEFDAVTKKEDDKPFNKYLTNNFYKKCGIKNEHIFKIERKSNDKFQRFLHKKTLDLAIIEIGTDGNICFHSNKPKSKFGVFNKIKLSESSREDYACYFGGDKTKIPLYGFGVNLKKILLAKKIIVIASGFDKATATAKLLDHKIDKFCVATYLIKNKNVIFYADIQALELVNK